MAFVIASTIWLFRRKDGFIWLMLAAGIVVSRIWTGVHYPSDVAAGAFIGFISAVLVHRLFARWYFAQKCISYGIGFYENVEQKVWAKKALRFTFSAAIPFKLLRSGIIYYVS
ncbi:phosphatase PAP2 family protein [Paenibacillus macerans]|nr:phosphatase PAP2 family protein [Paenibacillus macerans]